MNEREALKLALKTLEQIQEGCSNVIADKLHSDAVDLAKLVRKDCNKPIDAIREALAQPEQESVVCPYCKNSATLGAVYYDQNCLGCVKRMTVSQTPPPCPTCEALARTVMLDQTYYDAQRTWVGLTEEEIDTWNIVAPSRLRDFVRCIEAKLRKKNT